MSSRLKYAWAHGYEGLYLGAPSGQCADLAYVDGDQRNNDAFNSTWKVIR